MIVGPELLGPVLILWKWKALHYKVRDAFKPVIVSHEFLDSNLNVIVVSDLKESLNVKWRCLNFNSEIPIKMESTIKIKTI